MPFKTCCHCGEPAGVRTATCKKCGTSFNVKLKSNSPLIGNKSTDTTSATNKSTITVASRPDTYKKQVNLHGGRYHDVSTIFIRTPGKNPNDKRPFCPFSPINNSDKEIKEWCLKLWNHTFPYMQGQGMYMQEAIRYFANHFWPMYVKGIKGETPKYKNAIKIINETLSKEINSSRGEFADDLLNDIDSNREVKTNMGELNDNSKSSTRQINTENIVA